MNGHNVDVAAAFLLPKGRALSCIIRTDDAKVNRNGEDVPGMGQRKRPMPVVRLAAVIRFFIYFLVRSYHKGKTFADRRRCFEAIFASVKCPARKP